MVPQSRFYGPIKLIMWQLQLAMILSAGHAVMVVAASYVDGIGDSLPGSMPRDNVSDLAMPVSFFFSFFSSCLAYSVFN